MAIKDIPIDVVPDEEFNAKWGTKEDGSWRGYEAGTPTEQRRSSEVAALHDALNLQEETRSNKVSESLAERQLAEAIRSNKADESYKWAALAKSGSGGSAKEPTATEMLNAIRSGAVQYANNLTKGQPFKETRGLYKGQTFMSSGETPEQAAKLTIQMLQGQLGNLPISSSNYNDIVKTVYESLGLKPPTTNDSATDDLAELLAQLRG